MPYIDEKTLLNHIKLKQFSNVYLLFGKEVYTLDYYMNKMINSIVDKSMQGFNLHKFDGNKFVLDDFNNAVESLPVMAQHKCVIVNDINFEKISSNDTTSINKILDNIPPSTIIIFYITGFDVNLKKSPKSKKIADKISELGDVVEFLPKSTSYLISIIKKKAKKYNCDIDDSLANLIIQRVGTNINDILINLDKIFCYSYPFNQITKQDILNLTTTSIETTAFDFSKAILQNDFDLAYKLLDNLFYQKIQPISILGAINVSFMDLYKTKLAILSGKTYDNVVKDFNFKGKEFRIKNAYNISKKFSINHIRKCLKILMETDILLKSSRFDDNILLQQLVGKFIVALGDDL